MRRRTRRHSEGWSALFAGWVAWAPMIPVFLAFPDLKALTPEERMGMPSGASVEDHSLHLRPQTLRPQSSATPDTCDPRYLRPQTPATPDTCDPRQNCGRGTCAPDRFNSGSICLWAALSQAALFRTTSSRAASSLGRLVSGRLVSCCLILRPPRLWVALSPGRLVSWQPYLLAALSSGRLIIGPPHLRAASYSGRHILGTSTPGLLHLQATVNLAGWQY
jgi:hypothetical protein